MSNERDELAKLIYDEGAYCGSCEYESYVTCNVCREVCRGYATAILAAGYRKSRIITTVEDLDALPDAALILTEQGGYWESIQRMDRKNWWHEPGSTNVSPSEDLTLPATVLYEGATK